MLNTSQIRILLFILSQLILSHVCFAEGGGRISFSAPQFDFGEVNQGTKVSHEFTFVNNGSEPVTIQKMVPSCGCTASSVDTPTVEPGKSGVVKVVFDTAGFSGMKQKLVQIHSDDFSSPTVSVELKGIVKPLFRVTPPQVNFGEVLHKSSPDALLVQVEGPLFEDGPKEGRNRKEKRSRARAGGKFVNVEEKDSSNGNRKLLISLSPEAPLGNLRDRVVLGIGKRSVSIPVFATVVSPLRVVPQTVSLGVLESGSSPSRIVEVQFLGPGEVTIQDVEVSEPGISIQALPVEKKNVYPFRIAVDVDTVRRELRGVVRFLTSYELDGEEQAVSLNIFGVAAPRVVLER